MEMSIECPLCSQPGFQDVNSLWLTLIRATTRQLSCPICHEVLFGLDKLTIHLVSHSLHDQLVQACLAANLSPAPAILDKSVDVEGSGLLAPQEANQTANNETKVTAPVASYVLINFPTLENVPTENRDQVTVVPDVEANVNDGVKSIPPLQDISFTASLKNESPQEVNISPLLHSKTNDFSSVPNQSLMTPSVTSDICDPIKFVTPSRSLYRDGMGSPTASISLVGKKGDEPFARDEKTTMGLSSSPQSQEVHSINLSPSISSGSVAIPELATNNNVVEDCNKTKDLAVSCGVCGLSFKDGAIAMLHHQLIHDVNSFDEKFYQSPPTLNDRSLGSKLWLKRETAASQSREASSPLHRFPCHICSKVFRMRGSLMVHLRVAHPPAVTAGMTLHLSGSSPQAKIPIKEVAPSLSLQALSIEEVKASCSPSEKICSSENTDPRLNDHALFDHASPSSTQKLQEQTPLNGFGPVSALSPKLSHTQSPPAQSTSTEPFGSIFPCYLCNKTFSKDNLLTQHIKSHESKQWECDVCFKSFTTKYFLKKHKRLHTGEMPYTCGICNKSFTFQQSYHKHLLYHSDEKPHSCSECGRAFKELSTLHNHQRIHTGEKPWACETCGKCFRQRVSYLVHRRIHTGAMPYQCTVCLKSFRYKVSQRTHKCTVQPVGDVPNQPNDLLQQLLQTPGKEMQSGHAGQPPCVTFKEPSVFLKEQMQHLNIKQEQQHANTANILLPGGDHSVFLTGNESDELCTTKNWNNSGEPSLIQHHSLDSQLPSDTALPKIFNEFIPQDAARGDVTCQVTSPSSSKSITNYNLDKPESHDAFDSTHLSTPVTHATPPPSADFNIDLLQDILSMVMSPSENVPSPATQMRHLSLSSGPNDDDLEAGMEFLYGSCDSENTH